MGNCKQDLILQSTSAHLVDQLRQLSGEQQTTYSATNFGSLYSGSTLASSSLNINFGLKKGSNMLLLKMNFAIFSMHQKLLYPKNATILIAYAESFINQNGSRIMPPETFASLKGIPVAKCFTTIASRTYL
jgi:hypothetical protein